MAGLVPAIHEKRHNVDSRDKPGDDEVMVACAGKTFLGHAALL
jgi:hypothetical protein